VLRQAGAVYQFRHAALQDYLRAMHSHQSVHYPAAKTLPHES
jgi:hypothetical protein